MDKILILGIGIICGYIIGLYFNPSMFFEDYGIHYHDIDNLDHLAIERPK